MCVKFAHAEMGVVGANFAMTTIEKFCVGKNNAYFMYDKWKEYAKFACSFWVENVVWTSFAYTTKGKIYIDLQYIFQYNYNR